jgi:hypothetical protein
MKNLTDHFKLINQSTFISNLNRGNVLIPGLHNFKQKLEPMKDTNNNYYADQSKQQSNYMNPRRIK